MEKDIYCLEIMSFQNQFHLNGQEKKFVQTICCFIGKCYTETLFTAPNILQTPLNDLYFIKNWSYIKQTIQLLQKLL